MDEAGKPKQIPVTSLHQINILYMDRLDRQLHVFFFPFMAHGHTIPALDMAKLFASRGMKASIITTPGNAAPYSRTLERTKNASGLDISIVTVRFPAEEAGLPEGCESSDSILAREDGSELFPKFLMATTMLREPLEKVLEETRPDCLVADMFFPWATDAASKFGIPRLVFHGTSFFSLCTMQCLMRYQPQKRVSSDSEPFVVPNLPGEIQLTRKQLSDTERQDEETEFVRFVKSCRESEGKSFGVIVNSFYELEPDYADFYRKFLRIRAWHIGPVALCNRGIEDKSDRGKQAAINLKECLEWLDGKTPGSVVYVCFGSLTKFTASQLKEIAMGLDTSGQDFIWVVSKIPDEEEWLPQGFEEGTKGKGLIIRGWAPQVLILDHKAVGGFVTHCGWNSTLEGITAGKPMVTWPVFAEQFYNEKLVTDVLQIGVAVGVKEWVRLHGDFVHCKAIERAVKRIMVGEESEAIRNRASKLGEMAKKAVKAGGSSFLDFNSLIDELKSFRQ